MAKSSKNVEEMEKFEDFLSKNVEEMEGFEDYLSKNVEETEGFEDYLPVMAEKLGEKEFMAELCNGFRLLADAEKGVITLQSLKKNAALLGVEAMSEDQLSAMIESADLNSDGVLDQNEFCVLMLSLSPSLMAEATKWLGKALVNELQTLENR